MVNDFVLKAMDYNTADLDIKDFTYAILMGLMERHIPLNRVDNSQLEMLESARTRAIQEGLGPKR